MFRKALLIVCLLLLPCAALAEEEPQIYVIKKGDTLWGISQRFIKDPYYWPSLWSNNPFITNPHLIYPGQKIAIYDGRIEIVPAAPEEQPPTEAPVAGEVVEAPAEAPPEKAPEALPTLPKPEEAVTIKTFGGAKGFITSEELEAAGVIVDTIDDRILMAQGDKVFVQFHDLSRVAPGDRYSLFTVGEPVYHPVSGDMIGNQVTELGTIQISEINKAVATAVITNSLKEIQRGAKVLPYRKPIVEIELKRAPEEITATLVAAGEGRIALSQYDIIFLDKGSKEGVAQGNLLYIVRERQATEYALQGENLQLPDILLGSAVVIETQPHTASALILKSVNPVFRGDRLVTQTQ